VGRPPGARVFDALMAGLGLGLLVAAVDIAGFEALSSPGALPLAASAVLLVAAAAALLGRGAPAGAGRRVRRLLPPPVLAVAPLLALFAALLERLGFLLAAPLFLAAAFLVLDRRRPILKLVLAITATAVLYALFRLVFQVLLPEGVVPEREILAWLEDLLAGGGAR
jgi:hypothetical protein